MRSYNAKITMFSAFILAFAIVFPAFAGIGPIGSPHGPVVPSQPPVAQEQPAPASYVAPVPSDESEKPIIIIRFNQKNVYFKEALKKVVNAVNQMQAGVTYEVNSFVPRGRSRFENERINKDSEENLRAVLSELKRLGVSQMQTRVSVESSASITAQEIKIYVR